MQNEDYKEIIESLPLLLPYFSGNGSLKQDVQAVGEFLAKFIPIRSVAMAQIQMGKTVVLEEIAVFRAMPKAETEDLCRCLKSNISKIMEMLGRGEQAEGERLQQMFEHCGKDAFFVCQTYYDDMPCGLFLVQKDGKAWLEGEKEFISSLSKLMGAPFAARIKGEQEKLSSFVMNTVLDGMKASIYITDPKTDKILFMNQAMKKEFDLEHPEGMTCYKVLQRGMEERCIFCPIRELQKNPDAGIVYQWDEVSTVNGRSYHNYDSLIPWVDGSLVHLQQSIDMTEVKSANTDELTQLLTRRPGKLALHNTLEQARACADIVTIGMFDINNLKKVNDTYGHAEGDYLISSVTNAVGDSLNDDEYAFRLSGDEFIVVLKTKEKEAKKRLEGVLDKLKEKKCLYEASFCFGLVEVSNEHPLTDDEVMFLADERMYEQKRHFHIIRNEYRRKITDVSSKGVVFKYDAGYLYDALVQSTEDYLYVCNMETGIFRYSRAMVEEFNLPGEVIENAAAVWGAKVHPDDRRAFLESNQEISDGRATSHCVEYRAKNRRGQWVWVRCKGHLELDETGKPILFAGFISNLGKKNKIDHLTGLYNKLEFEDHIHHLMETAPREEFSVMRFGIDGLKHINDLYDRIFGDNVIRIVAQKLQSMLPADTFLYRLDGDEFGVIARNTDKTVIERYYDIIKLSFQKQQEHNGKKYYCTLSAGGAFYPSDANDFPTLLKYVDYSLEYAKNHGKNCCIFFSEEIVGYRSRMLEMIEALRESVENDYDGFSLRFQPLVEAKNGKLIGVEALARWKHEKFGEVSPMEFIPLLEQTGMIISVGKWVLKTAIFTCKKWNNYIDNFVVDVNLSYVQIEGSDFVDYMKKTIEEEGFSPKSLVLELTESYFAQENELVMSVFSDIREIGARIAMDDFGSGYSSLGTLKKTPADIVKIDKAFMKDILVSSFDATFIKFVVELCHNVDIEVCIEGVETKEEYEAVKKTGIDMIQGFYFDRPLTEEDFCKKYLKDIK